MPPLQRLLRRFRVLLRNADEMANGHLLQRHDPRPLHDLEAEVQHQDQRDVEVRGEERLGVPEAVDEDGVALGEEDDDEGEEAGPGGVGLEGAAPGELGAGDALALATVEEAEVDEADDDPECG